MTNDYNCMYANTTNYFNNGTPGVSAGAHDVTSDPVFVDAANDDYALASGSSCIDTGTDVGLTSDYLGNPIPAGSAPDIGAYEKTA